MFQRIVGFVVGLTLCQVVAVANAAETGVSEAAKISFYGNPQASFPTETQATGMRIVARSIQRRCTRVESYSWDKADASEAEHIISDTMSRLKDKDFTVAKAESDRLDQGQTLITADADDRKLALLFLPDTSANAMMLLVCGAHADESKLPKVVVKQVKP